jgi:hypothetical protein
MSQNEFIFGNANKYIGYTVYNIQFLENTQELGQMPNCMQDICIDVSNDERYQYIVIV